MGAQNKGYKRSWKNLLINKRYQLRFTLFMVGLSALLMLGLGFWVLHKAGSATTITRNHIEDRPCGDNASDSAASAVTPAAAKPKAEPAGQPAAKPSPVAAPSDVDKPAALTEEPPPDSTAGKPPAGQPPAGKPAEGNPAKAEPGADPLAGGAEGETGDPADAEESERPARKIQVDIGEMEVDQAVLNADNAAAEKAAEADSVLSAMDVARCVKERDEQLKELDEGYFRIKIVLGVAGFLLVIGLTIFGIKMTHKVAGPLYKVTLYFDKMRDGTFDEVYSLRKGDQLVEFYEQFKQAHSGIKSMQEQDLQVLRDVLEAAEGADLASRSPELAKILGEMRALLAAKEESIA